MSDALHVRIGGLPAVWRSYPGVIFRSRPPLTPSVEPRAIKVSVDGYRLRRGCADAYSRACGFEPGKAYPITYPHVIATSLHLRIFAMSEFVLRPMGLIHLSNVIESPGELTPDSSLDIEVSACNYRATAPGLAFDMLTEIRSGGTMRWRETCSFLARWPEPVTRSEGRMARPPKAPKDAVVLAELPVTQRMAWAYARVSGDYNPIHLNDRAARYLGLRGAIAHGMWSLARSLAERGTGIAAAPRRLDTQFLTPVQLPAKVAIKEWSEDGQVRRALCDVRTGRVHMYAWWPAG